MLRVLFQESPFPSSSFIVRLDLTCLSFRSLITTPIFSRGSRVITMSSTTTSVGKENAENGSVSELISLLRSAFQPSDFHKVEQILSTREENLKREIAQKTEEYNMMEKKHGEMALMKLEMEDELNKSKKECDKLTEQIIRSKEDLKVQREREKRAEARYTELSEKFSKVQSEFNKMSLNNSELVSARYKAERELESSRKRFEELNLRVVKLEEDTAMLLNVEPSMQKNAENQVGVEPPPSIETKAVNNTSDNDKSENEEVLGTDGRNVALPQVKESPSHCGVKNYTMAGAGSDSHSPEVGNNLLQDAGTEVGSGAVIEISDSDEEIPVNSKRKRDLSNSSSSSEDCSSSDLDIDSALEKIRSEFSKKQMWKFEADMIQAFKSDNELCMNAVCALYRQEMRKKKTSRGSPMTNNQGFAISDVLSGNRLGRYLTDGDPLGKLKKSASELQQHDQKGVDECRRLAISHSSQLFEIFQKEKDPSFLPL